MAPSKLKLVVNNDPRLAADDGPSDTDWLTPMEANTIFLCIKKGDSSYLLEEYVKSVHCYTRGIMLIANGYTGGDVRFLWVRPLGFCRSYDLVQVVEDKRKQDGEDHQSNERQRPADE